MQFERRRSQRILMRIPGRIYGSRSDKSIIYEEVSTDSVSAYGALLNVQETYDTGTHLLLTNLVTEEEIPCRVVSVGENKAGQKQVAIEFTVESPKFWRIHFPPPGEKPLKRTTS
jgi:beta-galactosidase/beta-glucuronidase